jgi:hypothetical protein
MLTFVLVHDGKYKKDVGYGNRGDTEGTQNAILE